METSRPGRFASLELKPARAAEAGREAPLRDAAFYMKEALKAELAGDHEKALNRYSAALGEDPLHLAAWSAQLWMLLYLGEPIEAHLWADKALEAFPGQPDLLALKSLALARCGLREEAWELNDAALKESRESSEVWLVRGELRGEAIAAGACFRHALAASSDRPLTALRCGDLCLHRKHYAEAEGYFKEAAAFWPDSAWVWYGLALAQRGQGWEAPALAAFARAARLEPGDRRYAAALAVRKRGLGRLFKSLAEKLTEKLTGKLKGTP